MRISLYVLNMLKVIGLGDALDLQSLRLGLVSEQVPHHLGQLTRARGGRWEEVGWSTPSPSSDLLVCPHYLLGISRR